MMNAIKTPDLRMIPVDLIEVMNHRERNGKVFEDISTNIKAIGLKKPITVTPRPGPDGSERYMLICGEGRLNTFVSAGQKAIPALVVEVSDEDAYIMSLAENIARRRCHPLEFVAAIGALRERGYDKKSIAQKTGLSTDYIAGVLLLFERGEQRLLVAVQNGQIPIAVAISIARAGIDDVAVKAALHEAYESGAIRGKAVTEARRVVQLRQTVGRSMTRPGVGGKRPSVTSSSLVRTYQKEVERQELLVRKAELAQERLLFISSALAQLLHDEGFATLLRAEGLTTVPKYLADRIGLREEAK